MKAVTQAFASRREDVLHTAGALINAVGVKGMTFAEIAARVGLNPTSITYYFGRKEQLVVAVYAATLALLETMAADALAQPDPAARVRHFLAAHIDLRRRIRGGEQGLITTLSELRTLDPAAQAPLMEQYRRVIRMVRAFFDPPGAGAGDVPADPHAAALGTARAHVLLESVFWWPVWSERYSVRDFPRIEARWFDILAHGLPAAADPAAAWQPCPLPPHDGTGGGWRTPDRQDPSAPDAFLRAATALINQRGFRGASVNRIAQALGVTKGSFYHHHSAKEDLVRACFDRSYDRLSAVQIAGAALPGACWPQLAGVLAELIDLQFRDPMPLLRTTALHSLDAAGRGDVVLRSDRLARRFAGMLIDGIADGSVRPIDPLIASQIIMSTLNCAYEARGWAARFGDPAHAVRAFAWTLATGLFTPLPR